MKRRVPFMRLLIGCAAMLVCGAAHGFGLDIGLLYGVGNLEFSQTRSASDTSFSGNSFPWGISAYASEQVSDSLSVDTQFSMDPILRNIVDTTVTYRGSYFTLTAGPTLGVFNSSSEPLNPGLDASVRLELPGVVFLSYEGDSSLGGTLINTGDYSQEGAAFVLGFYVPNAICSANILSSKYVSKTSSGTTIDQLVEYSFKTDLFQKNVPYRVLLTFGYQDLTKTFIEGSKTTVDGLGSLIVGTHIEFKLAPYLTFIGDMDSSVYTFGQGALLGISNPGPAGFTFRLQSGLQLSLDQLTQRS